MASDRYEVSSLGELAHPGGEVGAAAVVFRVAHEVFQRVFRFDVHELAGVLLDHLLGQHGECLAFRPRVRVRQLEQLAQDLQLFVAAHHGAQP